MNQIFLLNDDLELEINKPEARKIPEFKVLIERDKGSVGDSDGRKKYVACAEIYYIYLVYDVRSIYYFIPMVEKKEHAKKDAKLIDGWKEDQDIINAINAYRESFKLTAAGRAFISSEKAYMSFTIDTEDMLNAIDKYKELLKVVDLKIDAMTKTESPKMELTSKINEAQAIMEQISSLQSKVITNIEKFPKLQKTVKELAETFAKEGGSMKLVVGGRSTFNRED
jgi:hypothetical protein